MRLTVAAAALTALLVGAVGAGGGCTVDRAAGTEDETVVQQGNGQDGQDEVEVIEGDSITEEPGYDQVLPYVKALASQDQKLMRQAQRLAADGSVAEGYMSVQADIDAAGAAAGYGADAMGSVSVLDSDGEDGPAGVRYRACFEDDDEDSYCYTYADFMVNEKGEVVGFTVDGDELAGRLAVGKGRTGSGDRGLGSFTLRGAYITAHGALAVTGVLTSGSEAVTVGTGSYYRTPGAGSAGSAEAERRVRAASGIIGKSELPGGAQTALALYFEGPVQMGGVVHLILARESDQVGDVLTVRIR